MVLKLRFYVHPSSGVPIYRQLIEQVKHHVAMGRLAPGEFLPSVRKAAHELEINPMTVSKAYGLLEREQVVENVRGQGMRVVDRRPDGRVLKERKQRLLDLLKQVVAEAHQLDLTPEELQELLDLLLKVHHHE